MADERDDDSFPMRFMFQTMAERDPNKRKVKPSSEAFLDGGPTDENSSDDSDFEPEHLDVDSDEDSDMDDEESEESEEEEEDSEAEENEGKENTGVENDSVEALIMKAADSIPENLVDAKKGHPPELICGVCLQDVSLANDELVECDGCGVMVHEGCYGISDAGSVGSSVSSCSTEPWFCDACRAGNFRPKCELCPNEGGLFKETQVGQWVHLVCALFVPGVAFADVDSLTGMTLFEINYSLYGAKSCSLCEDVVLSRTGICISCDAGMCRNSFHVTCAQKNGLLQFPHDDGNPPQPGEQVDPYIAHCRMHSDKSIIRKKQRMYKALQNLLKRQEEVRKARYMQAERTGQTLPPDLDPQRLFRKLRKHRSAYDMQKGDKSPWLPTEKITRPFWTSVAGMLNMRKKASIMGMDFDVIGDTAAQQQTIADIRRKWHVPPAVTVEYVAYYLDRGKRLAEMQSEATRLKERKSELTVSSSKAQQIFEDAKSRNDSVTGRRDAARKEAETLFRMVCDVTGKSLPTPKCLEPPLPPIRPFFASPVRAANQANKLKDVMLQAVAGVRTDTGDEDESGDASEGGGKRKKSKGNKVSASPDGRVQFLACFTCHLSNNQHHIVSCDTCHKSYHMECLDPPLLKMPKKSKLYGWQCVQCVASSESEQENVDTAAPRKLRGSVTRPKKFMDEFPETERERGAGSRRSSGGGGGGEMDGVEMEDADVEGRKPFSGPKRKYVKKKTASGGSSSHATPSGATNGTAHEGEDLDGVHVHEDGDSLMGSDAPPPKRQRRAPSSKRSSPDSRSNCDKCGLPGANVNLVRCDECRRCFHFHCLDPPVTKSPKVRGYSWHCEDCDKASDTSDGPRFSAMKQPPKEKRRSALREFDKDNHIPLLHGGVVGTGTGADRTKEWVEGTAAAGREGEGERDGVGEGEEEEENGEPEGDVEMIGV